MTGAMYAAIAGLKTHMQNLNVIGNNVANINTYSYKAGRSVFQTAIYTQLTGRRYYSSRQKGWRSYLQRPIGAYPVSSDSERNYWHRR